ncbi:UDP-glucose/GDP-mannose dehydrogenase family protein [candidate division TA06 bacterium]|nr:UDP-glucose/GDP-mannose dehydrogenase family protein [candidate division TA06 bacterium]
MNIGVIGSGHVGLVTGSCFSELGNKVICMDDDQQKIEKLKRGVMPFYEPGLEELVEKNVKAGRLSFTNNLKEAVENSLVLFIAVGTPSKESGEADLTAVERVATEIARTIQEYKVIVEKSTVPVETGLWIKRTIERNKPAGTEFDMVSNPEFLSEGNAISDFMNPDRIVLGFETVRAKKILFDLYAPFQVPIVETDIQSAELIKHASNSFLSMKISFINTIATLSEKVGADVVKIAEGVGLDRRIGKHFLNAGVGFGGSCFGKDLSAFIDIAQKAGVDFELLKEVKQINQDLRRQFVKKVKEAVWNLNEKTVGVLGLSFKPDTDDLRDAPAIDVIRSLQEEGALVKAYDPAAMANARHLLKNVTFCQDSYEVARGADCLVILTEWKEFKTLNLKRLKTLMSRPIIIDGRNLFDPDQMRKAHFRYVSIGRPPISERK